jgi:AcrR family transcriptional regulator
MLCGTGTADPVCNSLAAVDTAARERPTPADAFAHATATWMQGERLDMQALAAELGIARATLYRWTGDREALLADVVWAQSELLLDASRTLPGTGAEHLAARADAFMAVIAASMPVRRFLEVDREVAIRVLTRSGTGAHDRSVARLVVEIEREVARGYVPRLAPPTLAEAIVRIVEGYLYGDLLAGYEPNVRGAGEVIRALL